MLVEIKNEHLTAKISDLGAELKSLSYDGEKYIWEGDGSYWEGSSPTLFPICSGLKGDKYLLDGKEYVMDKHGFAKDMVFKLESQAENEVAFVLTETEETLKKYPYRFEFRVTFTLNHKMLSVRYDIKNNNLSDMYFSVGAHEGYCCPEGVEEYDILFPHKTTLKHTELAKDNTLGYDTVTITENEDILPLKYKYFDYDALIFQNIDFNSLILKNRNSGRGVKVTFDGFPYLLLWTKPDAPFICVEPWCGITDREDTDRNFKNKQGIERISADEVFTRVHTLEFF